MSGCKFITNTYHIHVLITLGDAHLHLRILATTTISCKVIGLMLREMKVMSVRKRLKIRDQSWKNISIRCLTTMRRRQRRKIQNVQMRTTLKSRQTTSREGVVGVICVIDDAYIGS